MRGPPTRARIIALAATALVFGIADGLLLITSDHFEDGAVWAVFGPVSYTHLRCLLYTSPSPRDRS